MLIIGRKRHQKIVISDNIEITVLEIGRNRVRFGIQAPKDVRVHTRLQSLPVNSEDEEASGRESTPSIDSEPAPARPQGPGIEKVRRIEEARPAVKGQPAAPSKPGEPASPPDPDSDPDDVRRFARRAGGKR